MRFAWMGLVLAVLAAGCGDTRIASLKDAMSQTQVLLTMPEMAKLAEAQKGTPAEKRVAAFFSPAGQKLWPPRSDLEYRFSPPVAGAWPARIVVLDKPDAPWSIVVQAVPQGGLELTGYGVSLQKPALTSRVDL